MATTEPKESRDTTKLHPELQAIIVTFLEKTSEANLRVGIGECLRTVARQDWHYASGRTRAGSIITNAKGTSYSSMHQWGVAFDFYRNDGKGAFNDTGNWFEKVGEIGKECGLIWGGDWKNPTDRPHLQMKEWGNTATQLKNAYKTPTAFIKTWKDIKPTRITTDSTKANIKRLQTALNAIKIEGMTKLKVDGDYGTLTKKYLLAVWKKWKWNKDNKSSGWVAGPKTLTKLKLV